MEVKTLCLGVLTLGDASGYEIKKAFEDSPVGDFMEASYGSIYPALTKLTDEGLVTCDERSQEGRPDKKVYSITDQGRDTFLAAMSSVPSEDKYRSEFAFMMLFADDMSSEQISQLIDLQIMRYRQKKNEKRLETFRPESKAAQFLAGYGEAVFEASITYLQNNRHLLENPTDKVTPQVSDRPKAAATV